MIVHYAGGEVRKLLKKHPECTDLPTGRDKPDVYEKAQSTLHECFSPKMNRVYLMNALHQVKQKTREAVDTFYMRVQETVNLLHLEEMTKEEIAELITLAQLVNNCTRNSLHKKAPKDVLKLTGFLSHTCAFERAEIQAKEMTGDTMVNRVQSSHQEVKRARTCYKSRDRYGGKGKGIASGRQNSSHSNKKSRECYWCGGSYPHKGDCPALNDTCDHCKKVAHYSSACRWKKQVCAAAFRLHQQMMTMTTVCYLVWQWQQSQKRGTATPWSRWTTRPYSALLIQVHKSVYSQKSPTSCWENLHWCLPRRSCMLMGQQETMLHFLCLVDWPGQQNQWTPEETGHWYLHSSRGCCQSPEQNSISWPRFGHLCQCSELTSSS